MKYKYLLISNEQPSLHKTLKDISKIINKDYTTISRNFKNKHFISIDDFIIYKFKWTNPPPPTVVKFN